MVAISGGVFASGARCLRDNDVMVSKRWRRGADVVGGVTRMQVQEEVIWKMGGSARAQAKTTRQYVDNGAMDE